MRSSWARFPNYLSLAIKSCFYFLLQVGIKRDAKKKSLLPKWHQLLSQSWTLWMKEIKANCRFLCPYLLFFKTAFFHRNSDVLLFSSSSLLAAALGSRLNHLSWKEAKNKIRKQHKTYSKRRLSMWSLQYYTEDEIACSTLLSLHKLLSNSASKLFPCYQIL